jgi:hypothetical protein
MAFSGWRKSGSNALLSKSGKGYWCDQCPCDTMDCTSSLGWFVVEVVSIPSPYDTIIPGTYNTRRILPGCPNTGHSKWHDVYPGINSAYQWYVALRVGNECGCRITLRWHADTEGQSVLTADYDTGGTWNGWLYVYGIWYGTTPVECRIACL